MLLFWVILQLIFTLINFICFQIKFKLIVNFLLFFVIIGLKGGENTVKLSNKIVFALVISMLLLFSASTVFAGDNETISDVVSVSMDVDDSIGEIEEDQAWAKRLNGGK